MADLKLKIYEKYGIDISKKNLFRLYRIESADISDAELEQKFARFRAEKQKAVINATLDRARQNAQADLDHADKYEAVLRDGRLRHELYSYYDSSNSKSSGGGGSTDLELAREYFGLVSKTKTVRKEDLDFFIRAFPEQRKNRKAITAMLAKDMKIYGLGNSTSKNESDSNDSGKSSGPMIVNAFQEKTALDVLRCEEFLKKAASDPAVVADYPETTEGLYVFSGLDRSDSIDQFSTYVNAKLQKVLRDIQEKQNGHMYDPLRDALNTMNDLCRRKDVVDNFDSFRIIVNYSAILPYVYEIYELKPDTFKKLYGIAEQNYKFNGINDFILIYFKPVYSHFNINTSRISGILKKADSKTRKTKAYAKGQKRASRAAKAFPFAGQLIHWLTYWPIFAVYLIFEIAKAVFVHIGKLAWPIYALVLVWDNYYFPKWWMSPKWFPKLENLLFLRKMFVSGPNTEWNRYVQVTAQSDTFDMILSSMFVIVMMLAIYLIPAAFAREFVSTGSAYLAKSIDWKGYDRSFKKLFSDLKSKSIEQFRQCDGKAGKFAGLRLKKIIINLVFGFLVAAGITFCSVRTVDAVQTRVEQTRIEQQKKQQTAKKKAKNSKKKSEKKNRENKKKKEK